MSNLLHPEATSQHEHKQGDITRLLYIFKKINNISILKVSWQGTWNPQSHFPDHRVLEVDILLLDQISIEAPNCDQMTIYCLCSKPFLQESVDIPLYICGADLLNRERNPDDKAL
jgi:hypothetical protein